jgi:hypothetical protein
MRSAVRERTGIQRQRGFWLRCFLSGAWLLALLSLTWCSSLRAEIDVPKPLHLTHISGIVVNSVGKPVVSVEATLVQDDRVIFTTRTSSTGSFRFDHVHGRFLLRVARSEYAPAVREVYVASEIVTYLKRRNLFVIVGPGACTDACSSVFTSRSEFDRAIKKNSRH